MGGGNSHADGWADAPPIFFSVLPKRKRAVHGPKEKNAFGSNFARACKVAVRGSAYRCLLRFCLAFGHAMLFCKVGTAVPWWMVRRSSGCKDAFDLLLFPRVPLRYALPGRTWGPCTSGRTRASAPIKEAMAFGIPVGADALIGPLRRLSSTTRPVAVKSGAGCIPDFPGPKVYPRAARFRP